MQACEFDIRSNVINLLSFSGIITDFSINCMKTPDFSLIIQFWQPSDVNKGNDKHKS